MRRPYRCNLWVQAYKATEHDGSAISAVVYTQLVTEAAYAQIKMHN